MKLPDLIGRCMKWHEAPIARMQHGLMSVSQGVAPCGKLIDRHLEPLCCSTDVEAWTKSWKDQLINGMAAQSSSSLFNAQVAPIH